MHAKASTIQVDPPALEPVVVRYVVSNAPGGDIAYRIVIHGAAVAVHAGRGDRADVTITVDYSVAAAIASGSTSAHAAMRDGHVKVGGRAAAVVEHQRTIAHLSVT